jgi:hypothetical protein
MPTGTHSGLFLKENGELEVFSLFLIRRLFLLKIVPLHVATEVEGTFRVNGSSKRMRELQAVFETPPRVRGPAPPIYFF